MLPDWVGGYEQPLLLNEAQMVIDRVAQRCMALAQLVMATASERKLAHVEFSRWLGVAVGQLIAVAAHPIPELLRQPELASHPLEAYLSQSPGQEVESLDELFSLLAADGGWGNRNLAFVARQLRGDLGWWRAVVNL